MEVASVALVRWLFRLCKAPQFERVLSINVSPPSLNCHYIFFFFQAEDGIRDADVTGFQTCALPICIGAAITFIGAGAAAHYIFGLDWRISFLFSALIIVTGPTVISPILRNIPLKKDVAAVLRWEDRKSVV